MQRKLYNPITIFKRLICRLSGHDYDWKEYNERMEKEEHHAAGWLVYCTRCAEYKAPK